MAANPKPNPSAGKLIFAPAGSNPSYQADQYRQSTLSRSSLSLSPITQFHTWFTSAQSHSVYQPETVCLSTASRTTGRVSSRYVYLKELDSGGRFVIYSNWGTSRKAQDVQENPYASLAFWWREVERQVRVEGRVERMSREESQEYFRVRARGSKIGAWASQQTSVLKPNKSQDNRGGGDESKSGTGHDAKMEDDGREELERQVKEVEKRLEGTADEDIPCPEFWGGIRVIPEMIEFWQGRESRLHDRFRYTRADARNGDSMDEDTQWNIERLSP